MPRFDPRPFLRWSIEHSDAEMAEVLTLHNKTKPDEHNYFRSLWSLFSAVILPNKKKCFVKIED